MSPPRVILVSGLPVRRATSFSRQLRLLAGALKGKGLAAQVRGPDPAPQSVEHPDPAPQRLRRGRTGALILLGYPDQFPFLSDPAWPKASHTPVFLWAQCSRPPEPGSFGPALPVPLTPRTAGFLAEAGCARIGPVIPHGVDTGFFVPQVPEERPRLRGRLGLSGSFVIATVGAHTRRKRFDLILEAFAALLQRNRRAHLIIKTDRLVALDGTDLELQARRLGLGPYVRILPGEISRGDLRGLYWSMDVYLNLSEWEGFCLPVVEAMACGVPVISLPGQGPGEVVPYRELLVPGSREEAEGATTLLRADPAAAAAVLERAADSPRLLERLGVRGREAAERTYDIDRVAGMWEGLLRKTAAVATEG